MKKALLAFGALFVGFTASAQDATAAADSMFDNMLDEIQVVSSVIDVAKERETPVAVSTISPAEISLKVGNQEFPEIMNNTPGVYATKQGGGYGDSRISLRGFDQRNTSFLINGQPVNDMENGWVYWSNWQGLTDVASGIQIQRGLGASKLAVPSVGGTVSIFTKAAALKQGASYSVTAGNNGYLKNSVVYNTGKDENGWASSFLISHWMGNGYIYNTSGEGLTYFAAVAYEPEGSDHSVNVSFLGAGQWHHQRDVWVSIRDYDYFGNGGGTLNDGTLDVRWNSNGGTLNGEEYSMRRNFYNKPLATFNWDWQIADNLKLATSVYGSAGRGGGTGPRGRNYYADEIDILPFRKDLYSHYVEGGNGSRDENGFIDFDAVVAHNVSSTDGYNGAMTDYTGDKIGSHNYSDDNVNRAIIVRRASMNSHNWVGAISNLEYKVGDFTMSAGVDLRNYTGYHYRVLNDLMGLDAYYSTSNRNFNGQIVDGNGLVSANPFANTGLADATKIAYYNVGHVGWAGLNGMIEYNKNSRFNAVLQAGYSSQTYQREDFFFLEGEQLSDVATLPGGYVKGGANYNINEHMNIFFNAGMISRQPNFDAVFPNYANDINSDIENEQINSFELGYGYSEGNLDLNINAYSTTWGNRFVSRSFAVNDSTFGTAQFRDIDVVHNGVELEARYRVSSNLKLRGMLSVGDWRYTKDFQSTIFDDNQQEIGTGVLYLEGAKVGDAAQTVGYISADYRVGNYNFDLGYRYVDNLYADYSILDSEFLTDNNRGPLKLPSYGLIDMGATARYKFGDNVMTLRLNVNNLLNTTYIAESNSSYHAEDGDDTWNGIATNNYVWFGFGRTWNVSMKYNF